MPQNREYTFLFGNNSSRIFVLIVTVLLFASSSWSHQKSEYGIRHSVVISGPKTFEFNENDEIVWEFDGRSKDISKLDSGNYLVTYRDQVIELDPSKKTVWSYTQSVNAEIMSAQRLTDGNTLVTELGEHPRLVEVDQGSKVTAIIPIQPETDNIHMQTRMGRKLSSGNYLVPHRIMPFAKEYDGRGNVVRTFRVDLPELGGAEAKNGTFAAVRLDDGSTVVTCASGNRMVIFDSNGKLVWHLSSEELGGILNDVCGLQVLKSGNFVVSCYGNQAEDGLKLIEITPDKKIVWTYQNQTVKYVHNLQVLSTNGQPE